MKNSRQRQRLAIIIIYAHNRRWHQNNTKKKWCVNFEYELNEQMTIMMWIVWCVFDFRSRMRNAHTALEIEINRDAHDRESRRLFAGKKKVMFIFIVWSGSLVLWQWPVNYLFGTK